MKKITRFLFLTLSSMLILSGCSIEPRVYMPGYNVQWKNKLNYQVKHQNKDENTVAKNKASGIIKTLTVTEPVTPWLVESDAKNEPVKHAKTDKYRNTLIASAAGKKHIATNQKTGLYPVPEIKKQDKLKILKISKKLVAQDGEHKRLPLAGLIVSLLGFVLIISGVILLPISALVSLLLLLGGILATLTGIIMSALAMREDKTMGKIGVTVGILDIILFLIFTIMIFVVG